MNLLEHQAKSLLKTYNLPLPRSYTIAAPQSKADFLPAVIKSQVPVGGRGKAGGVAIAESDGEFKQYTRSIFALTIKGHTPDTLLIEEKIDIAHELYLSLTINRAAQSIELLAHKNGGTEIESQDSSSFYTIDATRLTDSAIDALADHLDIPQCAFLLGEYLRGLQACFIDNDCTLLEINPLIVTNDNQLVAGDCKMTCDDAARFRHPQWSTFTSANSHNFVTLNQRGTIATIANGAGLAMATVDAVADAQLTPANFLDIGGTATVESITNSLQKIMEFPDIQGIVINIFGGIVRCDTVAQAIVAAKDAFDTLPPLYIRLSGTNSEQARAILRQHSLTLYDSLDDCIDSLKGETPC